MKSHYRPAIRESWTLVSSTTPSRPYSSLNRSIPSSKTSGHHGSTYSGDWLHAVPISSCGLRLSNEAVRVAVGLRLGAELCQPYRCICGASVDTRGSHALSCRHNPGRSQRHHWMNDMIWRALSKAGFPSIKEPQGLVRTDGKRPDGLTLVPWGDGRCATWDVTVTDTVAAS